MKFGVIGEPCVDYIHKGDKVSDKIFGGILYSVVSLAAIAREDDEIYPIMYAGYDEYDNIISLISRFKNIKTDFILKCEQKIRVVNLYYRSSDIEMPDALAKDLKSPDRDEFWTVPTPPIEFDIIKGVLKRIDALLINMISGVEITVDTFKEIRSSFDKYIHLDLHNVVMKPDADGKIVPRKVEAWNDWTAYPDTLQMNETEMNIICPDNCNEYKLAEILLTSEQKGTKALVITRGKSGVTLYKKKEKNLYGEKYYEIDKTDLPAIEQARFKDSTGCGDVFASSFFYRTAVNEQKNYEAGLYYANKIASLKTTLQGVEELHKLRA
jgi:hypothetical protein